MRNIAITIGVSKYQRASELPACKNDAEIITKILKATNKYDVLPLSEDLSKYQILEQIEAFISSASEQELGEVLFYFSGHGVQDDEAHFILKDTVLERINSTALNNNEIDDLVRRFSPKLFVKIIDACQSGLTYIKAPELPSTFDIIPADAAKSLGNCIFMCSSKKDEYSMATIEYSFFTKAFVAAVLETANKAALIRYSDIQNFIIDTFQQNKIDQTPYFNIQSDCREIFSEVTAELKELREIYVQFTAHEETDKSELENQLDKFLMEYRSEDDVQSMVEAAHQIMQSLSFAPDWIAKYYDCEFGSSVLENYREDKGIVKFLYERRERENLYVEFDTERQKREDPFGLNIASYFTQATRFSSVANALPSVVRYRLTPKKEGLPKYELSFVFVYSDTYMYIFNTMKQFVRKGWGEFVRKDMTKYTYKVISYNEFEENSWKSYVQGQLQTAGEFLEKSISEFVKH